MTIDRRLEREVVVLTSALYYPNIGGVENSLRHLAEQVSCTGRRAWIITSSGGVDVPQERVLEAMRIRGVRVLRYRYSPVILVRLLRAAIAMRVLCGRLNVTTCVARDQVGALAAVGAGVATAYLVPGIHAEQHRPRGFAPLRWVNYMLGSTLQVLAMRRALVVATFSELMRQAAGRVSKRPPELSVTPGVDAERFRPLTCVERARVRENHGIPRDVNLAIAVGRFSLEKRFDLAVEAMQSLGDDWNLVLVGDGPLCRDVRRLTHRLGLADRVRFLGKVPDPERVLAAGDVFLLSSACETFGQVLLEALACGLPIAAFNPASTGVRTATTEVVPERWLSLSDRFDAAGLAGAIRDALPLGVDRSAIAGWARESFSWARLLQDLEEALASASDG